MCHARRLSDLVMNNTAARLARLIASATPAAIERKRVAMEAARADLVALEQAGENERAKFARALFLKRAAALGRMIAAAKLRA
jgi:hypothetical protein